MALLPRSTGCHRPEAAPVCSTTLWATDGWPTTSATK